MAEKSFEERLFDALSEMENPVKDSTAVVSSTFKYDYATLDVVFAVVKPTLAKHGLMLKQKSVLKDDGSYTLQTFVFDAAEERLMDERPLFFDTNPQNNGIRETYTRRYATNTAMGLAPVDSDAVELRDTVQTPDGLRSRVEKGIESVNAVGYDPSKVLADFAGWESDKTVAENLLSTLKSIYKTANTVQGKFPNAEIKEA